MSAPTTSASRQFVATLYVFHEGRCLLLWHKKLQSWLPPGGHLEENEDPAAGALREAQEETGLQVMVLARNGDLPGIAGVGVLVPPRLILEEEIPATAYEPAHHHIDFVYKGALQPGTSSDIRLSQESTQAGWFTLEQTEQMDLFDNTRRVLALLA